VHRRLDARYGRGERGRFGDDRGAKAGRRTLLLRTVVLHAGNERSERVIDADMRCAYRELEARLRPFVARRISAESEVDDVLQDVFLRLQRSLSTLRDEQRFGPWVYQVARSAIAEHRRSRARHPLAAGEAPDVAEPEPGGDDGAVAREVSTYLAPFIALLPTPYREALTLTELEGVTQKIAAEMMGVSLSGMKSRVQRGREKLRGLLEDCCDIALDARGKVIGCEPRANGKQPADCCCGDVDADPAVQLKGLRPHS
jgi:RNA polymerase sigma-70 factor (ECF subfamily)